MSILASNVSLAASPRINRLHGKPPGRGAACLRVVASARIMTRVRIFGDSVLERKAEGSRFAKPAPEPGNPATNLPDAPRFQPSPPAAPGDLALRLETILPGVTEASAAAGGLAFHAVGDTGGIHGNETQNAVAAAMQAQIASASGRDRPRFLFHLGDVVYLNGESSQYVAQFYEPYQFYDAPIFAIPGNHDGEIAVEMRDGRERETSLYGFMQNFCSPQPRRLFKHRATMTQPHCYWTLEAPYLCIIGLYSNIDGQLDRRGERRQQDWLVERLRAAPRDKWLIVAVHHPGFSLDRTHGGYIEIVSALDAAFAAAARAPDLALSGHVHSYQRFTRDFMGKALPYIVAGAGGFANSSRSLHKLQRELRIDALPFQTTLPSVRLEAFDEMNAGFLRLTAGPESLTADYFTVSFDDPAILSPAPGDTVTVVDPRTSKSANWPG